MAALLLLPGASDAKSYGSGGGRSYSSSSSHSSSFSGSSRSSSGSSFSRSSSSGTSGRKSSSSSSASSKSFSPSGGRSYSSGTTRSDESARSYSSGKSYSFGSDRISSSSAKSGSSDSRAKSAGSPRPSLFDSGAARAQKEQESRREFTAFKEAQAPKVATAQTGDGTRTARPGADGNLLPPITSGSYRRTVYVPDAQTVLTRPVRVQTVFHDYYTRPVVLYHDPYSSFFWWWLLDRSLDDRAYWAYHHRYDMDDSRYQALLQHDAALESRVRQLEGQQVPVDPNYTPPGLDRDLMYTERQVQLAYSTRPTRAGRIAFWILAVPIAAGIGCFLVWLVFFKRWQVST